jgi:peptidoglycan hydrolase-like protein with peptidoglycan-binding domain
MNKKNWLCYFGVALLLSATPVVSGAGGPAAQSSAKSSSTKKKRTSSSRSARKPKPKGQKAPTPDRIREIQSALQREGALNAEPTGKWDDATIAAMKKYQENQGLNPTGKIDALTLNKLGLGSDTAGKGAPLPTASSVSAPAGSAP